MTHLDLWDLGTGYKNHDPRANVLRKYCHRLLNEIDDNNIHYLN